jgi:hypothetical protein
VSIRSRICRHLDGRRLPNAVPLECNGLYMDILTQTQVFEQDEAIPPLDLGARTDRQSHRSAIA